MLRAEKSVVADTFFWTLARSDSDMDPEDFDGEDDESMLDEEEAAGCVPSFYSTRKEPVLCNIN